MQRLFYERKFKKIMKPINIKPYGIGAYLKNLQEKTGIKAKLLNDFCTIVLLDIYDRLDEACDDALTILESLSTTDRQQFDIYFLYFDYDNEIQKVTFQPDLLQDIAGMNERSLSRASKEAFFENGSFELFDWKLRLTELDLRCYQLSKN